MSYRGRTGIYRIPYPTANDTYTGVEETRKVNTLDNQIYGAIRAHSGGHGIIDEGAYTTAYNGATHTVTLSSVQSTSTPALEAFIEQVSIQEAAPRKPST